MTNQTPEAGRGDEQSSETTGGQSSMSEPTTEQLENVALVMGLGNVLVARNAPHYRQALLNLHALVQRAINGDEEAERGLAALRAGFGSSHKDGAQAPANRSPSVSEVGTNQDSELEVEQ